MKKKIVFITLLLSLLIMGTGHSQHGINRQEILGSMELANGYFMKKWPDVGKTITTDIERPSNIWTRAVYYEGLMALYEIYPKEEYYEYMTNWADFHDWGFRDGNTTRNADNYCAAQIYLDLYELSPEPKKLRNTLALMQKFIHTPQNDDWDWIDAIQMGMPVFAKLGRLSKDESYFEKMYDMYMYSRNTEGGDGLFNEKDGLWWRDKDFVPPYKEPNGKNSYWSRGNGWVMAALVRVLSEIPEDEQHREEYIADFKTMANALLKVQREDGFWNVSLHDSTHYGGKELSGTALFVYGLGYGVNNGILNREKYLPAIMKAWNGMVKYSLHDNGFLGYAQSTGKEPKDGQPLSYDKIPDFEDFGLGAFLLAGTEVYRITDGKQ